MLLTEVGNERQTKLISSEVGKVPIFKLQVGKVFFGQTTGGQNIIFPS